MTPIPESVILTTQAAAYGLKRQIRDDQAAVNDALRALNGAESLLALHQTELAEHAMFLNEHNSGACEDWFRELEIEPGTALPPQPARAEGGERSE